MDSINAGCCKCCRCDASALLRHVAADTSLCGNSSTPGELQPEHHGGNESAPASRGDAWQRWPSTLERLSTGQLVLDGGMGTEVEKLAGPEAVSAAGWSCVQSTAFPEECKQAHAAFLAAGADVIITNTYATNRHILAAAGAEELTERANRLACRVAFDARDEWCDAHPDAPRPLIAGSVSCHAPGDEVQKMQGHMAWPSPTEEATNYREQAAILAEEGVDLIFTEMVRDKEHGMRISTALGDSTVPVFMGLRWAQCLGAKLELEVSIRGTAQTEERWSLAEAIPAFTAYPSIVGINVHHTSLAATGPALSAVRAAGWTGPLGAYPDHGEWLRTGWGFKPLDPVELARYATEWAISSGVCMVGGCCGIGPAEISGLIEWKKTRQKM